ncbi:MAG: tyrosine-type recombinase/integrase [Aeromonas sobria]|jgi:integrase|uniref:tyrosine-type recombinase/integrase n=1 Tax=Aeromonas sobria TaxID=646 RepID=UPI003F3C5485
MIISNKLKKMLDAAPGVHIHGGRLRLAFKLPGKSICRKSLSLLPTEANILYASNKLAAIKIDILCGLYSAHPDTFWRKHFPDSTSQAEPIKLFSLKDYFEIYRDSRQFDLSYSSLQKIRSAERFMVDHYILNSDITSITHRDLEHLRNNALKTRKVGTVQEYFRVIRAVFGEALKDEVIDISPFDRLRRLRQSDELPKLRVEPFTRDELSRLLNVTNIENHRLMIEFLFWTGMRPGEMKAVAWEDIDMTMGLLKVRYNINRLGQLKPPKTTAGNRTIELLPAAMDVLKRQRELTFMLQPRNEIMHLRHNKKREEIRRRVFLGRENMPYIRPELFTAPGYWARLLRKAQLTHREPYQLRHSYASMLLMAGAHPAYLAKQLGHKDWGMIRTIYAQWVSNDNPNYRDELAEKLGFVDPYMTQEQKAEA